MAKTLSLNTADVMGLTLQFPEYSEPIAQFPDYIEPTGFDSDIMAEIDRSPVNKMVEQVIRTPGRQPSPQPTHFDAPYANGNGHNGNGHRILRSATVGYIAPEFKGKNAQMAEGELRTCCAK
jgi:glutamate dehydrogenase